MGRRISITAIILLLVTAAMPDYAGLALGTVLALGVGSQL